MIPLTNKVLCFWVLWEKKYATYVRDGFVMIKNKEREFKLYHKVRYHCHYTRKFRGAAHNICNLTYKVPKKIPTVFHNDSTYDYHFIIKQLAEECKGQFECLGENTEKYINFSVPIKKEHDNSRTITYKLKFIDSYRLMPSKLSDLVDNLSEIFIMECIKCMERKKLNQNAISLVLKIIDWITDAKNAEEYVQSQ